LNGIVNVTSSTDGRNHADQVADGNWFDYWYSGDHPNRWISFNLKERRVSPAHYTIKSASESRCHLLVWELEGSNDNPKWQRIDGRATWGLNGNAMIRTFAIPNLSNVPFFRYVRLRQTSKNSSGCNDLTMAGLELFGRLLTRNEFAPSRRIQQMTNIQLSSTQFDWQH
jgi:hypothetical protein